MSYKSDGALELHDLRDHLPNEKRLAAGAVAVVECVENIPCNPCVDACPRGAISVDRDINDTPSVDYGACNGCGLCISACPGLAIFIVDCSSDGDTAIVSVPYEFLPLPDVGETVSGLSRKGREVAEVRVTKVVNTKALDRTPIVSLEVPKELAMTVRHFRKRETRE